MTGRWEELTKEESGALLGWSLENCTGSERGLPGRHVLNSRHEFQPALVGCLREKRPSRRTRSAGPPRKRQSAAWAYKTGMGPITK